MTIPEAALRRLGSLPFPGIERPVRLNVEFQTTGIAHAATKGVTRSGTWSVQAPRLAGT